MIHRTRLLCPVRASGHARGTRGPSACFWGRGFSIIELLLVLAIIGTISAVAVPRMMEAESRWRIEGAAQRVAADLAEARALAIASSSNVQTTFDRTGYVVRDADGAVVREIRLSGRPYDVEIPSVSFGGASTVRFNGHGAGSASGTVTLTTGGLRCRVAVEASSGAIKVEAIGIDPSKTSGGGGR